MTLRLPEPTTATDVAAAPALAGAAVAPVPAPDRHEAAGMGGRAASGAAWTLGGYAAGSALRLGGNLVLTRLLFPEAFGLMAVVNAIVQGLNLASDLGVGQGVIQNERGEDPDFLATAWTMQIARRALLGACCALLAAPLASFYGGGALGAELANILPIIGVTMAIEGLLSMRALLCRRWLTLGRLTMIDLSTQGLAVAAMIAYAAAWPTVWALVVGSLVRSVSWVALSHLALLGPRDRIGWDPAAARALFSFGKWIFVSTLLGFLAGQADRLVLGKLVPWGVLGVYGIAAVLAAVPSEAFTKLASAVLFPVLSRLRGDEAKLHQAARDLRAPILLACGAIVSALLAGGGIALVDLLYDHRYADAGWMLQALAVGAWWKTLDALHGATLLALGRTRALAASNAVRAAGAFLLAGAGWYLTGFPGAIVGLVVADAAKYAATTLQVGRSTDRGVAAAFAGDVGPTLRVVATAAVGAGVAQWLLAVAPVGVAAAGGAIVALAFWTPSGLAWLRERRAARAAA